MSQLQTSRFPLWRSSFSIPETPFFLALLSALQDISHDDAPTPAARNMDDDSFDRAPVCYLLQGLHFRPLSFSLQACSRQESFGSRPILRRLPSVCSKHIPFLGGWLIFFSLDAAMVLSLLQSSFVQICRHLSLCRADDGLPPFSLCFISLDS